MKVVLTVYIFSAFLVTGFIQLQCFRCTSLGSTTCTVTTQTCSAARPYCLTSSVSLNSGFTVQNSLLKTCSAADFCNKQITGNFGNLILTIRTDCCTTDSCNSAGFNISGMNTALNGRFCNGCYGASSSDCAVSSRTPCAGNQDQCITASGNFSSSPFYVSGCASSDLCSATIQDNLSFISIAVSKSQCTLASISSTMSSVSRSRTILLASTAIFALKFF